MMSSTTSERLEQSTFFLWMRIVVGSVSAVDAVVHAGKDFHNFLGWIQPLALACWFLFWRIREPGEPRRIYLTNRRVLITALAALAGVVSSGWWIARHIR
jgi:hypothetical protein